MRNTALPSRDLTEQHPAPIPGRAGIQHEQNIQTLLEAVIEACTTAVSDSGIDSTGQDRLRHLLHSGEDALQMTSAELGIDSLTWLQVFTLVEERFDILLPDEAAISTETRTPLGLAHAVANCLPRHSQ